MREKMFEDYIYINRFYFSVTGVWPVLEKISSWRYFINKFHSTAVIISLILFTQLPMLLDLYYIWGNINAMVKNLSITVHSFSIILKLVHIVLNKHIFKKVLRIMKNNFNNSLTALILKEQKIIILKHANFALFVTKGFVISVYSFQILLFLLPFYHGIDSDPLRPKRYPFCAWYYFDQNSNVVYAICYGTQVVLGFCLALNFGVSLDSFIFTAIWHSCAQLKILQCSILNLGVTSKGSFNRIQEIVQNHNKQIRNFQILIQLFSKICLYQILTSCFVICLTGLQLFMTLGRGTSNFGDSALYFFFLIANLFQILLYCWPSNQLMEQGFEVGNAAYQCLWTNLSKDSSKAIILIILRAQNPLIITAGGMYKMTLKNVKAIIKMSMSLLSVLRVIMTQNVNN